MDDQKKESFWSRWWKLMFVDDRPLRPLNEKIMRGENIVTAIICLILLVYLFIKL